MFDHTGLPQSLLKRVWQYGLPVVLAGVALLTQVPARSAERAVALPPPQIDEPGSSTRTETAVLAGGCFWGVQGVYQHVKGVTKAVSGYAGGQKETARYDIVGTGRSGHAEAVEVTYDPRQISYGQILQIYFSVAHDPTQLNRQGPDSGSQYRSALFPKNDDQARVASAYINQIKFAGVFEKPVVTKIEPSNRFYPAETYHQDYLVLHPSSMYIAVNDLPKIENLKRMFPALYRANPVLVASSNAAR